MLFLKPKKCKFLQKSVNYLSLIISNDHLLMDPVKAKGVTDWPLPTKLKEVQSFLGFMNFYHWFIQIFSEIT